MAPDEALRVASIFNPIAAERKTFWGLRNVNLHKGGHPVVLETNGVPILDSDGNFSGYRGFDRDVTERDRAEMDLRKSEERFRRVVEHIGDAVIADNLNGHIVFANDRFLKLFGFSREQLPTLGFENYIAPEYREQLIDRHYRRMRGEDVPTHFEYEGVRTDGTRIWLEVDVVPVTDSEGKIIGTQSAIRDITERRRAERAIQESEQRLRHLIEVSSDWIFETNQSGAYTYAGPQCRELLGYEPKELLGKTALDLMPADEADRVRKEFKSFYAEPRPVSGEEGVRVGKNSRVITWETKRVRKDGRIVVWETSGIPIFDKNEEFRGYRGMIRDITERKQAEDALASIGRRLIEAHEEERTRIGRELHDDINQRLALLTIELDLCNQKLSSSPELQELIVHAQQRIHEISTDVQTLSHRLHSSKLDYLGLATAANSFCRELSEKSGVSITFSHTGIPPTLPKEVSLCLFRVLQEALQNAVKHSGVKDFTADLHGTSKAIELTVTDRGRGFEELEALTRQGIGLISMRERLQLVKGELSIQSNSGSGTTIRARVPLQESASQALAG